MAKPAAWLTFLHDEDGAVTVDWVVLSAAVIGLGLMVLMPIAYATDNKTKDVSSLVAGQTVGYGN